MYLRHLIVSQFKNIAEADLTFSPGVNAFYGNNGEGKTNLLDAVHYLSMCKTSAGHQDRESIRYGSGEATLFADYDLSPAPSLRVSCLLRADGEKRFKCNGKNYERLSDHIGLLPLVLVAPSDTSLVYGAGQERRRYINFLLSQSDSAYLQQIQLYQRNLQQRNYLLKTERMQEVMPILERQLDATAAYIYKSRKNLCDLLRPKVREYYSLLSKDREQADMDYISDLHQASMGELMLQYADKDRMLQFTSCGIQRDDLRFTLDGHSLKTHASQGQQKTFLLAVKLAQFALLKQQKQVAPILLLDDVFDKLDIHRVEYLLQLVTASGFGQIFITDSNKTRVQHLVESLNRPHAFFEVEQGHFTLMNTPCHET